MAPVLSVVTMKEVWKQLHYGDIEEFNYKRIRDDIDSANRQAMITLSAIVGFTLLFFSVYLITTGTALVENIVYYLTASCIFIILLILSIFFADEYRSVLYTSIFVFLSSLLLMGIVIASVTGRDELTASFFVFLFATPLLFTMRPRYADILVVGADVIYMIAISHVQTGNLYNRNMLHAIVFGITSILIGTYMTNIKIGKIYTDYQNRILMDTDQLTGLNNRHSYQRYMDQLEAENREKDLTICVFDVNGLKYANDNFGHDMGDAMIQDAARCIKNALSPFGSCYRIGGDEFVAILDSDNTPSANELRQLITWQTSDYKDAFPRGLSIASGIAKGSECDSIKTLLGRADEDMYKNKAEHYANSKIERRRQ